METTSLSQVVVVAPAFLEFLISPTEKEVQRLGHEVVRYYPER